MKQRNSRDMKEMIFTVNPGSTTTKCALFNLIEQKIVSIAEEKIEHLEKKLPDFLISLNKLIIEKQLFVNS